jgi:ankyrin repeat protein
MLANQPDEVIKLFSKARAKAYLTAGWVDINAPLEQSTERSLLHLASKNDNIKLVNWALEHGADPGVRDTKGKKPIDVISLLLCCIRAWLLQTACVLSLAFINAWFL